jgi:hypothetical protein
MKTRTYGMSFPQLCNVGFVDSVLASDANYQYIAYAKCGTDPATEDWAVKRVNLTTGSENWAGGTNDTIHAATDLPALFI